MSSLLFAAVILTFACSLPLHLQPDAELVYVELRSSATAMPPGSSSGQYSANPNFPGKIAPLIESANMDNPQDSYQQEKQLAEIFAKEPIAASGSSSNEGSKEDDILGLNNDPLDIVGSSTELPDVDTLQSQVAELQAQIKSGEAASAELTEQKSQLAALQAQLSNATSARNVQNQAQQNETNAANAAQLANSNAAKSAQIQNQIQQLQKQQASLETELSALNGSGNSTGEAYNSESSGENSAASFVQEESVKKTPVQKSSFKQKFKKVKHHTHSKQHHSHTRETHPKPRVRTHIPSKETHRSK